MSREPADGVWVTGRLGANGLASREWVSTTIGDVSSASSGTTPARSLSARYYEGGTVPWAKTLDLNNSEIWETDERVTPTAVQETSLRVNAPGSVLVAMYGGFNQIGRTGLLRIPAAVNQAITAVSADKDVVDPRYLLNVLNYHVSYWRSVASSSRKDPNITREDVRRFPLELPPLDEQRAIANALGDVDALLDALDRLIAKQRDLKQAAMQQLLTGRTRLPGFTGEWQTTRLGEICQLSMGRTPLRSNMKLWRGTNVWLSIADMAEKVVAASKECISDEAASAMPMVVHGTLMMSFKLTIGRLCFAGCDLYTNEAICAFNNLQASAEYLFYALTRVDFSLYGKQAVKGYTLNKDSLALVEVPLPSRPEQTAIAAVLSDMDAGIKALEARRAKTRDLKQAMLQELLTGRTRLV